MGQMMNEKIKDNNSENLSIILKRYANDHCLTLNELLARGIKKNFDQSVSRITLVSCSLTNDILNIPKKNITYKNLLSILQIHHKNENYLIDIDVLKIKIKRFPVNFFHINKLQAIGWIYIMQLNEKLIFDHYRQYVADLPDTCMKHSLEFSINSQGGEWRSFNRKLSKIDFDSKSLEQICSGIDQAGHRLRDLFRKYDEK